jgi:hypothetical protein
MVNTRKVRVSAVLASGGLLLAACHGEANDTPAAHAAPQLNGAPSVKRGPSPEELTAGMVEAVTMGKSTVPVAVKFDLPQKPVAGQPVDITIAVMPQVEADPATVAVAGSDSLVLAQGSGPIEIPAVEPTQVYRHNIKLTPTAEGVQLLGLSVTLKHDEIVETREFAVPLIVAAADAGPVPAPAGAKHAGLKSP